jgi:hypothetical protein
MLKLLKLAFAASIALIGLPATAGTIVSLSGPNYVGYIVGTFGIPGGTETSFLVASWSATGSYSGVQISYESNNPNLQPVSLTAYLMTQIGPGTTVAQQIAFTNFDAPANTDTMLTLFSGLSLSPGTYYLVLGNSQTSTSYSGWEATSTGGTPTVVTAAGVTLGDRFGASGELGTISDRAFPPASTWGSFNNPLLHFQVESVPEPGTFILVAISCIGVLTFRRRSS